MVLKFKEINKITSKQIKLLEHHSELIDYYQFDYEDDLNKVDQIMNMNFSEANIARGIINDFEKENNQYFNKDKETKEIIQAFVRFKFVKELIEFKVYFNQKEFDKRKIIAEETMRKIQSSFYTERAAKCCLIF